MRGLKTNSLRLLKTFFDSIKKGKITSDISVQNLMETFGVDEEGHQASIMKADLGYGWIHYCLVRAIKPRRILCIGSRHGYVPALLAQACKDNNHGLVDFVDPGYGQGEKNHWTGVGLWKTERGKNLFKNYGLGRWIRLFVLTSKDFSKKYKRQYQYIYIDGDHSYKGVSLDFELFWPRLKNNGFMVFHDVSIKDPKPEGVYGVHKLWKEISKQGGFTFPFEDSGLGVLQKLEKNG